MKIKILHLFYDFLNLYGESFNSLALHNYFVNQEIEVELIKHNLEMDLDIENVDVLYVGAGEESKLEIAFNYLKKYQTKLKNFKKTIICTGNATILFSKNYLNIQNYEIVRNQTRIVKEEVLKFKNQSLIGFYNTYDLIKSDQTNLFLNKDNKYVSYNNDNFYAIEMIGPFLVRNYFFLKFVADKVILNKKSDYLIKEINFEYEKNALTAFLKNYYSIEN